MSIGKAASRHTDHHAARLLGLLTGVSFAALLAGQAAAAPRGYWSASSAATATAAAAATAGAQQAAAVAAQAQQSMTQTTNAIRGLWTAQAAARSAAAAAALTPSNNIVNGLGKGTGGQLPGLVVDPRVSTDPSLWINASLPTQTVSNGQTNVTVVQSAPNAVVTWEYFNIGHNTTLTFNQQGNASWVVLNRIDATGVPSQILGSIKADGTVLLINPNGIIFSGTSQINVGSLIATTFDITSSSGASPFANYQAPAYYNLALSDGVTVALPGTSATASNEDAANIYFSQNGLYSIPASSTTTPATGTAVSFSKGTLPVGLSSDEGIQVQASAAIATATSANGDGGYVALLGTAVTNSGGISTPGGQIILAATGGPATITDPASSATGVNTARTLTFIGPNNTNLTKPTNSNVVTNGVNAILEADDGNITLAGGAINQYGGLEATTSTNRVGSIVLTTDDSATAGDIVLGRGSLIAILPDELSITIPTSTATPAYFTGTLQPQITISASGNIDMQSGAAIKAPSAAVTMNAGTGAVLLESGSSIDLSGLANVVLPLAANQISILVTAAEVADTPLAASLIGKTVTIDARLSGTRADGLAWVGSPLLDAAGFVGTIPETIDQILTAGGKFTASAPQSVIQAPGSVINVSGGYVTYQGGTIKTTTLIGADGRMYNIGSADPTVAYVGIAGQFTVDHPHWGASVTEIFTSPLFAGGYYEPSYIAGVSAGSISFSAITPILAGTLIGDIVTGRRQQVLAEGGGTATQTSLDQLPAGASLNVTFGGSTSNTSYNVVLEPQADAGPDPYGLSGFSPANASTWVPALTGNVFPIFSDSLTAAGFGSIKIALPASGVSGNADVPTTLSMTADAVLSVRPGGSVTLNNVTAINGTINAPSGDITLSGVNYGGEAGANPPPVTDLVIGATAVLNVRGLWVNDTGAFAAPQGDAFINGGTISITTPAASRYSSTTITSGALADGTNLAGDKLFTATDVTQSIVLAPGSVIDVSGGGYVGTNGKLKYGSDGLPLGKGGSLTLQTYAGGFSSFVTGNSADSHGGTTQSSLVLVDGTMVSAGTAVYYLDTSISCSNVCPAQEPNYTPTDGTYRANVVMGGAIYAAGFDGGGTLTLGSASIKIGGSGSVTSYLPSSSLAGIAAETGQPTSAYTNAGTNNIGASAAAVTVSATQGGELDLPASFFTDNAFGAYVLTSGVGDVAVTSNTIVNLRQSNLLAAAPGQTPENQRPTGAIARQFESFGQVADGLRKPVNLTLYDPHGLDGILVDNGAWINADPNASGPSSISLFALGPVTVLGSIVAPSGSINLFNVANPTNGMTTPTGAAPANDVWIGPDAILDVGAMFVPNPLVTAYTSGSLLDAGMITLYGGTVVVESGAQFRLDGSAAMIQAPDQTAGGVGALTRSRFVNEALWSNGGTLQIGGNNLYFAGAVSAYGGAPEAAGGNLTVGNVSVPNGVAAYIAGVGASDNAGTLQGNLAGPTTIVVEPGGSIAANLPTTSVFPVTPSELAGLVPGSPGGYIGSDTLSRSGFDSVGLYTGSIAFNGSVNVSVPGSLTLVAGSGNFVLLPASASLVPSTLTSTSSQWNFANQSSYVSPAGASGIAGIGGATVNLDAGYVRFVGAGFANAASLAPPQVADGTLNVNAKWIDLQAAIGLDNVLDANFTSAGAIRLLPDTYGGYGNSTSGNQTRIVFGGALITGGNLTLAAAEVYPVTNTQFLLASTGLQDTTPTLTGDDTLAIMQNGVASAPLSVGGSIVLYAQNINQGGTLWAPLGGIVVGLNDPSQIPSGVVTALGGNIGSFFDPAANPTKSVDLMRGSLTSVSAAGLDIPDGFTVDGTTWYLGQYGFTTNNIQEATVITASMVPGKSIGLSGANIKTESGAVIDASGGGDIYATEFVAGTGGSRNVLTTAASGQTVYALVPSYEAVVAAYDPTFDANYGSSSSSIAPGSAITIAGGNGIAGGTYVLLPGMYATLPGAYRVVQVANNVNPTGAQSYTTADGSAFVKGTLTNVLTGASASKTSLFELQSNAVWTKYSQVNITSGTSYFRSLALAANTAIPQLPIDGGLLTIGATSSLSLASTNQFAPGTSDLADGLTGAGGQVDISATDILIVASDQRSQFNTNPGQLYANYLVLDANQISALGATSVLIGGTTSSSNPGAITVNATNVEVATDVAHPLTGPELLLVTAAGGNGITVDSGSVIRAVGTVPAGTDHNISIGADPIANTSSGTVTYSAGISGDGSLLRVSNGGMVTVTRHYVPGVYTGPGPVPGPAAASGSLTVGAGAVISGNSLTLDSSNTNSLASNAVLTAQNYDLSGNVINIGGGSSGLVLTLSTIANFAGAQTVSLRSASVFNLYDASGLSIGDAANPIGTLTFDGAGLYSDGGTTTITALNIVFTDSQATQPVPGAPAPAVALTAASTGTLNVNAGVSNGTVFGAGSFTENSGTFTFGNFGNADSTVSSVKLNASQAIAFGGSGSLNAGAANVTLTAPELLVNAASTQALTTTGTLTILPDSGTAPANAATNIGGALTLTAASIGDSGLIEALSGNVTLVAMSGDITLSPGAAIVASGSRITIGSLVEDTPGGTISLVSVNGNVMLKSGSLIDIAASGNGYAGSLNIATAQTGSTALNGTLDGAAAFNDLGGSFTLSTGSYTGALPFNSGFTRSFEVSIYQPGDITIPSGTTLTSGNVLLVANQGSIVIADKDSNGNVMMDANGNAIGGGTIDASGPTGGTIALYGAGVTDGSGNTTGGVMIGSGAKLFAYYASPNANDPNYANGATSVSANGGTITLGTTGAPTTVGSVIQLNADGSEKVAPGGSGTISVAPGATINVSAGAGGTGGQVILRAPVTTDLSGNKSVNVSFYQNGSDSVIGASSVALNAYEVWSTNDPSTGGQHFDGIIDPAGWYNSSGTLVAGSFVNASGTAVANWNGSIITNLDGTTNNLSYYLTNDYFTPTAANAAHQTFYAYVNGDSTQGAGTLLGFVNNPFNNSSSSTTADDAVKAKFGGGVQSVLHLRPEIDLYNPNSTTNNGSITVSSNWNFGAGTIDSSGAINLAYRSTNGREPGSLVLRALNNIAIDATITDGFFVPYDTGSSSGSGSGGSAPDAASQYAAETASQLYLDYLTMFGGGSLPTYDASGLNILFIDAGLGSLSDLGATGGTSSVASAAFFNMPQAQFNSLQFQLQQPSVFSGSSGLISQYNQYYAEYVSLFHAYETEIVALNTNGANAAGINYLGSGITGGAILSYSDYFTVLSGLGSLSIDPSSLVIPAAPTTASAYYNLQNGLTPITFSRSLGVASTSGSDYASQWVAYLFNVINMNMFNNFNSVTLSNAVGGTPTLANAPGADTAYPGGIIGGIAVTPPYAPPVPVPTVNSPNPADLIANNPAIYSVGNVAVTNTTTAANLMSASLGNSFSYNLVAGAAFTGVTPSVNPNTVIRVASATDASNNPVDSVLIDGHTSYANPIVNSSITPTINVPTLVRTGTGSITVAAAGDVEFLDTTAPGAIYTAGAATTTPADFSAPIMSQAYLANPNGLVSAPAWATGGGSVTISAGLSIIGIEPAAGETWNNWYYHSGASNGTGTPFSGSGTTAAAASNCGPAAAYSCQTAAWVNYATFGNGIGALGGGNISLVAGKDIIGISASLPETLAVSGGVTANDPPAANYYGGGDLLVQAGGNINSASFLVGRGAGLIIAGSGIGVDPGNSSSLPLLLAVQDGFISAVARGPVTIGAVYDPASLPIAGTDLTPFMDMPDGTAINGHFTNSPTGDPLWSQAFTTYGPQSGIALSSIGGDVTALGQGVNFAGLTSGAYLNARNSQTIVGLLLPAALDLTAYSGNIVIDTRNSDANLVPIPTASGSDTGTMTIVAAQSVTIVNGTLAMPDLNTSATQYLATPVTGTIITSIASNYISPLGIPLANLTQALHANDPAPVIITAGANISGYLSLIKPAQIEAGNNVSLGFIGQNNNLGDVTSIRAGNDITGSITAGEGGYYYLYGPGALLLSAGHDLGPFELSSGNVISGVAAIGNGSNGSGLFVSALQNYGTGSQTGVAGGPTPLPVVSYLPAQSADITVLFGVGHGINYQGAINQYVDPASAGANGINFLADIAGILGETRDQAWADFQSFSTARKDLLVDRAFLDFLTQVATDYRNSASTYYGQYGRAYTAIGTLFPARYGYTDNAAGTGGNGAAATIPTGNLNIAQSVLETTMGGDINIVGPGGGITVGSTSTDTLKPIQEGILTLAGGSIRAFTDSSILLNQSRIMTLQGGDIDLFSANGGISAGEGPKTYVSDPPVTDICDFNGYCRTNPFGLVTGAGIGALVTLPGQDPSKSNVTLVAPHGTVDVSSAGIRVSGNLNIVALQVLNAFNIQVQGTTVGLPTQSSPNIGALTSANNVAGAAQTNITPAPAPGAGNDTPSMIIVEVIGYGGGYGGASTANPGQ